MNERQLLLKRWIMSHVWNLWENADDYESRRGYSRMYHEVAAIRTAEALQVWLAGWFTERSPYDVAEWLVNL